MHYSAICTAYSVKKCEKIDLNCRNLTWKALHDMKEARGGFNPCLFKGYVYLCGYNSKLLESFDPQTERFCLSLSNFLETRPAVCMCMWCTHTTTSPPFPMDTQAN